jgi:5-formyltetrahydrofolate cyclo-ligase
VSTTLGQARSALEQAKAALRRELRALRRARAPAERGPAGAAAAQHLQGLLAKLPGGPVALFLALPLEIDTAPALAVVAAAGRSVLLPRQEGRDRPLAFHAWRPGDPLLPGPFGVLEPVPLAPRLRPGVVVAPLLAFDRAGRRLGHGAGFYDRTLRALRGDGPAPAVLGLAFAFQEVAAVPAGPDDERLDGVLTEAGFRDCGG